MRRRRRSKGREDPFKRPEGEDVLLVAVPATFVDAIELLSALNGLAQVLPDVGGQLDALCNEVLG